MSKKIVEYRSETNFDRLNSLFGSYERASTIDSTNMRRQTCTLILYEFKHDPPLKYHDAFKVVAFEKNGKGKIVRAQLSHQWQHKHMLFTNFKENPHFRGFPKKIQCKA